MYLLKKYAIDPDDYLIGKVELPPMPEGKYQLGVSARFTVDNEIKSLSSEIELEIIN